MLTPNSLNSEWVLTELDAGIVKKIEGTCRLVPVLAGVEVANLPPTLRAIKCVRLEPYEAGLRELLGVCHNVSAKPPLGPPPPWAAERPLPSLRVSGHAQRVAALLHSRAESGIGGFGSEATLEPAEVVEALQITEDELAEAADELDSMGWAELYKALDVGRTGFVNIAPTATLFFAADPYLKGWNPSEDAKALAAALVNAGGEIVSLDAADKVLGWGPRRINPAAQYLALYGYVKPLGGERAPYVYDAMHVSVRARRFAREA